MHHHRKEPGGGINDESDTSRDFTLSALAALSPGEIEELRAIIEAITRYPA